MEVSTSGPVVTAGRDVVSHSGTDKEVSCGGSGVVPNAGPDAVPSDGTDAVPKVVTCKCTAEPSG